MFFSSSPLHRSYIFFSPAHPVREVHFLHFTRQYTCLGKLLHFFFPIRHSTSIVLALGRTLGRVSARFRNPLFCPFSSSPFFFSPHPPHLSRLGYGYTTLVGFSAWYSWHFTLLRSSHGPLLISLRRLGIWWHFASFFFFTLKLVLFFFVAQGRREDRFGFGGRPLTFELIGKRI